LEIAEIVPVTSKSLTLPWEETLVLPIGDVQVGAGEAVAMKRLRKHIEWGLERPNVYFLGMGDYVDLMSPSNRESWRAMRKYDAVHEAMQQRAKELTQEYLHLVRGTEGRWLGVLEGHHWFDFEDGTTSDTRIAQSLKTTFLGSCADIVLEFREGKRKTSTIRAIIWCHHGFGGGRKQSGPINKLEDIMPYFEADVYLMGHQSKKPAAPVPRIYVSQQKPYRLIAKKRYLAGTGGFCEGYHLGSKFNGRPRGSYIERGMMSPVALGGIVVKLRPVRDQSDGLDSKRLDINIEI
jgi:hypothetical protein